MARVWNGAITLKLLHVRLIFSLIMSVTQLCKDGLLNLNFQQK